MSHRLIQQLRRVQSEYGAARGACALTLRRWPSSHDEEELDGRTLDGLREAIGNLEATYIARLFAEFEAILRRQHPHSRPNQPFPRESYNLISSLRRRYRIPPLVEERVNRVRSLRHAVVHGDPNPEPIAFKTRCGISLFS